LDAKAGPVRIDGDPDVLCGPPAAALSRPRILGRDGAAQVRIDTLEIIASSGRIDLRDALAWAEDNRAYLIEQWERLSGGEQ
jgi:hypothetical protein